jgi:hypothetical protein
VAQDDDEREARQLALMRDRIASFRAGTSSIGLTIADLEGLVNALTLTPEAWRDRFMEEWSVLEIAYAVALDRRTPLPTATSDREVREALDALDGLLDEWEPGRT